MSSVKVEPQALLAVVKVLKARFTSLTAEEVIALAVQILGAIAEASGE